MAAAEELGARKSDDDLAVGVQGGQRLGLAVFPQVDGNLPQHVAVCSVKCDKRRVELGDEDLALPEGHSAICLAATNTQVFERRQIGVVRPLDLTRRRLEREDVIVRRADIHNTVDHQRLRLERGAAAHHARVQYPGGLELRDVR